MEKLSNVVKEYIKSVDDCPNLGGVCCFIDSPHKFDFTLDNNDQEGRYCLSTSGYGRKGMEKAEIQKEIAEFITNTGLGDISSTSLNVHFSNGQQMQVEQNYCPEMGLWHYEIKACSLVDEEMVEEAQNPELNKYNPLLEKILEQLYGLKIPVEYDSDVMKVRKDEPDTGVIVSVVSKWKYGTEAEQKARDAISKADLSGDDRVLIRCYRKALIDDIPPTEETKSIVLQKGGFLKVEKLNSFYRELPAQVESISLFAEDEESYVVASINAKCIPLLQLSVFGSEDVTEKIDLFWQTYSKFSDVSLDDVRKGFENQVD